jgi:hypothetical protein
MLDEVLFPVHATFEGLQGDPLLRAFTDTLTITLSAPAGGTIRYTLDGTEPTKESKEYTAPLKINVKDVPLQEVYRSRKGRGISLCAQAFDEGGKPVRGILRETLWGLEPRAQASVYYSHRMFDDSKERFSTPDFTGAKLYREVLLPDLTWCAPRGERDLPALPMCAGVASKGKIKIETPGKYVFVCTEAPISQVFINGGMIDDTTTNKTTPIDLKAGTHGIEVRFAYPNPSNYGPQEVKWISLAEGQAVEDVLGPPKKENGPRTLKGEWHDDEELLLPLQPSDSHHME